MNSTAALCLVSRPPMSSEQDGWEGPKGMGRVWRHPQSYTPGTSFLWSISIFSADSGVKTRGSSLLPLSLLPSQAAGRSRLKTRTGRQAVLEDNVVCFCFQAGSHVAQAVLEPATTRVTLEFWSCLTCWAQVCFMGSWGLNSGPHMNARQLLYYLNYIPSREKIWLIVIYKFEASFSIHDFQLVHK